jgi:hypothetical protein
MSMHSPRIVAVAVLCTLAGCATPPPPVTRPALAKPPPPIDTNIGTATMLPDGTLLMKLRTTTDDGEESELVQKIPPGDIDYAADLKMVGPIKPGETKPINAKPTS